MDQRLKQRMDDWVQTDPRISCWDRIVLLKECEKLYENEPHSLRYGKSFAYMLKHIPIEYTAGIAFPGKLRKILPTPEQRAEAKAMFARWWEIPDEEFQRQLPFCYSMEKNDYSWIGAQPPWMLTQGHLAYDWEAMVEGGLLPFKQKAEKALAKETDPKKREFYEGAVITMQAIEDFILRFGDIATRAGDTQVGEGIKYIATQPPRTLYEAMQLIRLVIFAVRRVMGFSSVCMGRMDRYFYPFYEKDIAEGRLTRQSAFDLIQEFLFRDSEGAAVFDHMSPRTEETSCNIDVSGDDNTYFLIAGKDENGNGFVNDLTHLFIEAIGEFGQSRTPVCIVRYFDGMEEELFQKAAKAMVSNAPVFIYNDETMMRALMECGVKAEHVWDYGMFGCNNPTVLCKMGSLRQMWFNLAIPLELVLFRGKALQNPPIYHEECAFPLKDRLFGMMESGYDGIDTGDLDDIATMDEFLEKYRAQVRYLLGEFRKGVEADCVLEKEICPQQLRVEDCYIHGPMEAGESWITGAVDYHLMMVQGGGLATVTDSLYAINKLCFEDKTLTLSELAEILKNDFEGNELLLRRLQNKLPKFGNDVEEVDAFATKLVNIFADCVQEQNGEQYLYQLAPGLSTLRDFSTEGAFVAATPNGRRAGEPLSENQSPTPGADVEGLSALFNSLSRVPFYRITGGPFNIRLHPSVTKGQEGIAKVSAALRTYMQQGGMQVQMSVVDAATLRAAQAEPEKYRGLTVRVTGYNAYFTRMSKKGQDELIARTEYGCF
ncbi:MAG: hypothetical protein IJP03_01115 [Christensenellaceae bacterium]|nr:hypothetical protein [Christensenellaceae bacterium]